MRATAQLPSFCFTGVQLVVSRSGCSRANFAERSLASCSSIPRITTASGRPAPTSTPRN